MLIYIMLTIITCIMAYYVKKPMAVGINAGQVLTRIKLRNRILMCGVFLLLFAVAGCRVNVGNDYVRYEEFFRLMMIEGSDGAEPRSSA